MLDPLHRVPPDLAIGRHLAEFGGDLAIVDDADRLGHHRRNCSHQAHTHFDATQIRPAEKVEIDAAAIGTEHLHHRCGIVEHEEPVPPDEHPVEEQHAVLLVEHLQWMAPRPEPARHRLARQDLEPG
jgi:hypothetical protein